LLLFHSQKATALNSTGTGMGEQRLNCTKGPTTTKRLKKNNVVKGNTGEVKKPAAAVAFRIEARAKAGRGKGKSKRKLG